MRLCVCDRGPVHCLAARERLRCAACGGWTPYGRPASITLAERAATDAAGIFARALDDLAKIQPHLTSPTRRGETIRTSGPSDSVGALVADPRRLAAREWAVLASRLLERAVLHLRLMDDALGRALEVLDPGPASTPSALEVFPPLVIDAELDTIRAAARRRAARGEE
jgi:hypothetical protein